MTATRRLTRAESLQEEEDISSRTGSVPSIEEAYNLDSLFEVVNHPE